MPGVARVVRIDESEDIIWLPLPCYVARVTCLGDLINMNFFPLVTDRRRLIRGRGTALFEVRCYSGPSVGDNVPTINPA